MDFDNLMKAIGVKLNPLKISDEVTVYIKLPTIKHNAECADPYKAIFYCVVDENGNQIFDSAETVETKVDLMVQLKLNSEINRIFSEAFKEETVEKK